VITPAEREAGAGRNRVAIGTRSRLSSPTGQGQTQKAFCEVATGAKTDQAQLRRLFDAADPPGGPTSWNSRPNICRF
jgi:hypothetical protein